MVIAVAVAAAAVAVVVAVAVAARWPTGWLGAWQPGRGGGIRWAQDP